MRFSDQDFNPECPAKEAEQLPTQHSVGTIRNFCDTVSLLSLSTATSHIAYTVCSKSNETAVSKL